SLHDALPILIDSDTTSAAGTKSPSTTPGKPYPAVADTLDHATSETPSSPPMSLGMPAGRCFRRQTTILSIEEKKVTSTAITPRDARYPLNPYVRNNSSE